MDRLTVPGVGGELLLQHVVVPAERDGLLVVLVSVPGGDVSLPAHVEHRAGEVGLDEGDHGFLLGVVALQGLCLGCTAEKGSAVKVCPREDTSNPGDVRNMRDLCRTL